MNTVAAAPNEPEAEKRYAFWKYDLFPFLLSGEVEEVFNDGTVAIVDSSYRFRYTAILKGQAGLWLRERLKALELEHRQAEAKLAADFKVHRNVLLAQAGLDADGKSKCAPQCGACCAEQS